MIAIRALTYMLVAAVLAAIFYPTGARAEDLCPDWWGTAPFTSYHFDRRRSNGERWNEKNIGLGIECKAAESWRWGAGYYPNSFKRDTFYAGVMYTPLRWLGGEWGGSVMVGTGYSKKTMLAILPTAAIVWEFDGAAKGWGLTVFGATSALGFKVNRDF